MASLFPFKDIIPHPMISHVEYKFNCEGCDASYVGNTIQCLSHCTARGLSGNEYHAFKEHKDKFGDGHSYKLEDVKIVCAEKDPSLQVVS